MFAIEIIWILVLLTCVSSHSLPRQEEEIDIEVEADSFETSFSDSIYECSRKGQDLRQNNTKFLIPLGKSKVGLLDGTSISFKADALLQPNGSLTIHTTMIGVMKEDVRQMSGRAPPSTFNPGFKPDRPSFAVMLTEAVTDFSFRMMINTIHGMIRMTNQGKETEVMSKMIMCQMESIQCTLDFRRDTLHLELCVNELNRCFSKTGLDTNTSFWRTLSKLTEG